MDYYYKSRIILIASLIAPLILLGQRKGNYTPLEFNEVKPYWTHVSIDSSIIDYQVPFPRDSTISFDGYGHVFTDDDIEMQPIIHDGYYYKIARTLYDIDVSGGLIEKIRLTDGKKIWQYAYDRRFKPYREFTERAVIRDNKLLLLTLRITTPDYPDIPLPKVGIGRAAGALKLREIDLLTGKVLRETEPDITHPRIKIYRSSAYDDAQINILKDGIYEVVEYYMQDPKGSYITIDTINEDGLLINNTDTIISEIKQVDWGDSYWDSTYKTFRADNGILYYLDFYVPGKFTKDTARAFLRMRDGNNIKNINLDQYISTKDVRYWYIKYLDKSLILIDIFHFDFEKSYLILTLDGTLVKSYKHTGVYTYTDFPILNPDTSFIITQATQLAGGYYGLDYYQIGPENNSIKKTASWTLKRDKYIYYPSRIKPLDNGDFLISGRHSEDENGNFESRFMTDIKVRSQDIGLKPINVISPTKEKKKFISVINQGNHIRIIPMGGLNNLIVELMDLNAKILIKQQINDSELLIPITQYPSGLYIITCRSKHGNQNEMIWIE